MSDTPTIAEAEAALLPILIAPHKSLKTKARAVGPGDMDAVREAVPRLFHTMYKAPGIGLAAPQVNMLLRFFVVDVAPKDKKQPIVLINPELVNVSRDLSTREEGCLSLPNQYADVTRPAMVRISFSDLNGKRQEIDAEGLMAACLQHELDHLDGVLFTDHISMLKRNMIFRKLAKEQRYKAGG